MCVFVMLYPSIFFVYFSTSLSSTVYTISFLFSSYFSRPVKLYFQPSFSVISFESTCFPFANKYIVIFSGLTPSLLPSSSQVFVPSTSTVSGVGVGVSGLCVFVMLYPSIFFVYFSTSLSSTVYTISFLFSSYFSRPVKLYFQPSFSVISFESTCFPFANKYIVIFSGLTPSLLPSSSQVFVPVISIVSGISCFSTYIVSKSVSSSFLPFSSPG